MAPVANDQIAKRNTFILIIIQIFAGCLVPVHFTLGGLAGKTLVPGTPFVTLAVTMTIIGSMVATPIVTKISINHGRKIGFILGTLVGALGALIAAIGLKTSSFFLLNLGGFLIGAYSSTQGLFRFAATEFATPAFRTRAISYVLLGGIGSAVLGPTIAGRLSIPNIWLPYLITATMTLAVSALFFMLNTPSTEKQNLVKTNLKPIFKNPRVQAALIVSIVSYAVMNFMMTAGPLAIEGCGFSREDAANAVRLHVLAMFVPSFFTGSLIRRLGSKKVIFLGAWILGLAGIVGLIGTELLHFNLALALLGVGWNFGFIGGTSLLTESIEDPVSAKQMQGLNDTIMWSFVALASLGSGFVMNTGSSARIGWNNVNHLLLVILVIAMALGYWKLRQSERQ